MSCFIVSDEHMHSILHFAKAHAGPQVHQFGDVLRFEEELTNIGRQLMQVNCAAFRSRYEGRHAEDIPTEEYTYERPSAAQTLTPIAFIKLVDCLAYQCSDWPEWHGCDLKRMLEAWQNKALHLLPGFTKAYDAAPWSI